MSDRITKGKFQKPQPWQEKVRVPTKFLAALGKPSGIRWSGKGMEPIVPDGAAVFVDTADQYLVEGDLYFFHFPATAFPLAGDDETNPEALQLRRVLSIREDGVLVGQENPECQPRFIESDAIRVFGKVKIVGTPTGKEGEYSWSWVTSSRTFQS